MQGKWLGLWTGGWLGDSAGGSGNPVVIASLFVGGSGSAVFGAQANSTDPIAPVGGYIDSSPRRRIATRKKRENDDALLMFVL